MTLWFSQIPEGIRHSFSIWLKFHPSDQTVLFWSMCWVLCMSHFHPDRTVGFMFLCKPIYWPMTDDSVQWMGHVYCAKVGDHRCVRSGTQCQLRDGNQPSNHSPTSSASGIDRYHYASPRPDPHLKGIIKNRPRPQRNGLDETLWGYCFWRGWLASMPAVSFKQMQRRGQ